MKIDVMEPGIINIILNASTEDNIQSLFSTTQSEEIVRKTDLHSAAIALSGLALMFINLSVVVSSGLIIKKGFEPLATRCTYLLLGNVALSDLITGSCVFTGALYPRGIEFRTHIGCCLFMGLFISMMLLSAYSVTLIAVDRYLYIMHGLKYNQLIFVRKVRWLILGTWITATTIGFAPLLSTHESLYGQRCWFVVVAPPQLIIFLMIMIIIPIVCVCTMHSIILCQALKTARQIKNSKINKSIETCLQDIEQRHFGRKRDNSTSISSNGSQVSKETNGSGEMTIQENIDKQMKTKAKSSSFGKIGKNKAIKVVFLTTGCFTATWLYFMIACGIFLMCDKNVYPEIHEKLKADITKAILPMIYFNGIVNPLIYAWWHKKFRTEAVKLWKNITNNMFVNE